MGKVTFKGKPIHINGSLPKVGSKAPAFSLIAQDLHATDLDAFKEKKKILNVFISLDTPVCSKSVHQFQAALEAKPDVVVVNISMDLPFAASRFCKTEGLAKALTLSAFRSNFPEDYGVEIAEGPLEGLCARAIFVLGRDNTILHSELVSEITQEPNYEAAISSLGK